MLNPSILSLLGGSLPAESEEGSLDYVGGDVAGVANAVNESNAPSGYDKFASALKQILPVLGGLGAYNEGALGSFTGGMLDVSELQRRQRDDQTERDYRRGLIDRQNRMEDRLMEEQSRREAAALAAAEQAKQEKERGLIAQALDAFEQNPNYAEGIDEGLATNSVITVPGIGRISLKDALERVGVAQVDGKYLYGKPAPRSTTREPLVTGIGPDGKPTRVPDRPGTRMYERPRVPREAPKETRRSYTWKDDDPDSETFGKSFRIIEDAEGNIISQKPLTGTTTPGPGAKGNDPLKIR